jgi:Tfp pilus assembly protein PilF
LSPDLRAAGVACISAVLVFGSAWGARVTPGAEADSLHEKAIVLLAKDRVEDRRVAMWHLERATLLDPNDLGHQLALAKVYYRMGFLKQARQRFERASALAPDNPAVQFGLGEIWRRDYLKYLDRTSLRRAVSHYRRAADLAPEDPEPFLRLAPLQLEQNELPSAMASAERSLTSAIASARSRAPTARSGSRSRDCRGSRVSGFRTSRRLRARPTPRG